MERLPEFSVPHLTEIPRHVILDVEYWGEIYISVCLSWFIYGAGNLNFTILTTEVIKIRQRNLKGEKRDPTGSLRQSSHLPI